jgi:hypothetical protein
MSPKPLGHQWNGGHKRQNEYAQPYPGSRAPKSITLSFIVARKSSGLRWCLVFFMVSGAPNVERIRVIDGAVCAPHEKCHRGTQDPTIGSALSFVVSNKIFDPQWFLSSSYVKDKHVCIVDTII